MPAVCLHGGRRLVTISSDCEDFMNRREFSTLLPVLMTASALVPARRTKCNRSLEHAEA